MAAWVLWDRYIRRANPSTVVWTALETVMLAVTGFWLWKAYFVVSATMPNHDLSQALKLSGSCWLFAALIGIFAAGRGLIGRILSIRLCVFLGEISFSIYMLHQVLMKIFITWMPGESVNTVLFFAVLMILATAAHLLIEKPSRELILRVGLRARTKTKLKAAD